LGLASDELLEGCYCLLNDFNDVGLELSEVVLYGNEIVTVVVLLHDLFTQAVENSSLNNIRVFSGMHLAAT
jgi:hypothetical protein